MQCCMHTVLCVQFASIGNYYNDYNVYILDECDPVQEFKCIGDGLCISKSSMCDGVAQCIDGSDEPPSCSELNYIHARIN